VRHAGCDWVSLLGVWQTGEVARAVSCSRRDWWDGYRAALTSTCRRGDSNSSSRQETNARLKGREQRGDPDTRARCKDLGAHDMVTHMKTTVEIPDPLLKEAKRLAEREGTTLRALIERGLRLVVAPRARAARFRLRDATVGGRGLQPGARNAGWDRIRELVYEDRGG
jgi:hypothetical protein